MAESQDQAGTEHEVVRIETEALCGRCRLVAIWLKNEEHERDGYGLLTIGHSSKCPMCIWLLEIFRIPIKITSPDAVILLSRLPGPCYSSRTVPYLYWQPDSGFDHVQHYVLPLDDGQSTKNLKDTFRLLDRRNIDFNRLRYWINYCQTNHGHACTRNTQMNGTPPAKEFAIKVIDCKHRMITAAALSMPYVALSYVWGTGVPGIIEEKPSPDGDLHNLLPDSLPRTIEDAIFATLQLGYRYLWVDKYCIDQSDLLELHTQLSLMNSIYQAASVTIVAASGADSNFGLPGVSDRCRTPQMLMHLDQTAWALIKPSLEQPVLKSAWSTRAWTYQESFFSRRQLFFTDQQVLFECCEMSCCELVDRPLGKATKSEWHITRRGNGHMSPLHVRKVFPLHISSYTKRLLTYQSDVLRAMQGLFSYFASPSIGKANRRLQFWGICVSPEAYSSRHHTYSVDEELRLALAQGLCWYRSSNEVMLEPLGTKRRNGFPSWSWSGWNIPINWFLHNRIEKLSRWNLVYAVSLEKRNGAQVPFTAALAEQLCTMSSEDIGVTYLSLEDEVGGMYQSGNRSSTYGRLGSGSLGGGNSF
ncbi:heterokaryon incompatibility protein-domain-containing protein [Paraphoma chrysanthemicola]|nr:heterokaryon incompatibility protein-domain-containing protein [Paraphoma chrysanthemicola]